VGEREQGGLRKALRRVKKKKGRNGIMQTEKKDQRQSGVEPYNKKKGQYPEADTDHQKKKARDKGKGHEPSLKETRADEESWGN